VGHVAHRPPHRRRRLPPLRRYRRGAGDLGTHRRRLVRAARGGRPGGGRPRAGGADPDRGAVVAGHPAGVPGRAAAGCCRVSDWSVTPMFWRKTVRSMRAEFGPAPAERWPELADYTDEELMARDLREIVAEIEARRAEARRRARRPLVAAYRRT